MLPASGTLSSASSCRTRSVIGARSTVTGPSPRSRRAFSTASWDARLPASQTARNAAVRVKESTALWTKGAAEGGRSRRSVNSCTIPAPTVSAITPRTAGSEDRGAMLSTYRLVSATWCTAQAASAPNGSTRHAATVRAADSTSRRRRVRGLTLPGDAARPAGASDARPTG